VTVFEAVAIDTAWAVMAAAIVIVTVARLAHQHLRARVAAQIALGVAAVGLLSLLVIVMTFVSPNLGGLTAKGIWLIVGVCFFVSRAWRVDREVAAAVGIMFGFAVVYIALLYLWDVGSPPVELSRARFTTWGLPADNAIPMLFADRIARGQETAALLGDWNGSDRPPLQSGFLLLETILPRPSHPGDTYWYGISVAFQMLWVPALYASMRVMGVPIRATVIGVAFTGATATMLLNSIYTWPKLGSAAFVLSSVVLLWSLRIRETPRPYVYFIGAGMALAFGALSHGATAFVLPLVALAAILACRALPPTTWVRGAAFAMLAAVLTYAPWMYYQRFEDPPGNRLLKWHLAGVIPINDRSFFSDLRSSYTNLPIDQLVSIKLSNLRTAFDPSRWNDSLGATDFAGRDHRMSIEFFYTSGALGIAVPILAACFLGLTLNRLRNRPALPMDANLGIVVAALLACMVWWSLLMFEPTATLVHQGSHVWVMLLLAIPVALVASRQALVGWGLVAVQLVLTGIAAGPSLAIGGGQVLQPRTALVLVFGVLVVAAAAVLAQRSPAAPIHDSARTPEPDEPPPGIERPTIAWGYPHPAAAHETDGSE